MKYEGKIVWDEKQPNLSDNSCISIRIFSQNQSNILIIIARGFSKLSSFHDQFYFFIY